MNDPTRVCRGPLSSLPLRFPRLAYSVVPAVLGGLTGCAHPVVPPPPQAPFAPQIANVRAHPNDLAAHEALAEAYASKNEQFGAIEQLQVAIHLGDASEATALRLADLLTTCGDPEEADTVLSAAAERPHPSPALLMAAARTRFNLGDFQGAAAAVTPLTGGASALSSDQQQTVARVLLQAGEVDRATPLIPKQTRDPDWLALAGLREEVLGHAASAEAWLTQALNQNPTDGWNAYLLGAACLSAGHTEQARAAWNAAVQMQDAPARAFIGLARLNIAAGQADAADRLLGALATGGRLDPLYWQAEAELAHTRHLATVEQIARGYAAFQEGDPWRAEAIWLAALPKASDTFAHDLYEAIINSTYRREDKLTSLRYAARASARWPDDPMFLRKYGEILLGNNLLPQALAAATRLSQVSPPDKVGAAVDLLGRIALDSSRGDLVAQYTREYRALVPASPIPLLQQAEWQSKTGRTPENLERTLKLYQEAATLAPSNAEAEAHVGLLLFELKRTDAATLALLHALMFSPRVLEGTPDAILSQIYQRAGRTPEVDYHVKRYSRLRAMKQSWPPLMKAMRQERPAGDWMELGMAALNWHEDWIALCAFHRATKLTPQDPAAWRSLAAAQKRLGRFEEALMAMRRAQILSRKGRNE